MRAAVLVAVCLLPACYHSSSGDPSTEAADAGPAKCPFGGALSYDPSVAYPFCQWETDRGFERYCPPSEPDGWGYMNWHVDDHGDGTLCDGDGSCNACLCFRSCYLGTPTGGVSDGGPSTPTSCPTPETGTAVATCAANSSGPMRGTCVLFCDHGERCPDGMRCVQDPPEDTGWDATGHHICAWDVGGDRCSL